MLSIYKGKVNMMKLNFSASFLRCVKQNFMLKSLNFVWEFLL